MNQDCMLVVGYSMIKVLFLKMLLNVFNHQFFSNVPSYSLMKIFITLYIHVKNTQYFIKQTETFQFITNILLEEKVVGLWMSVTGIVLQIQ